jgi:heterodisulfide reductase subunit B
MAEKTSWTWWSRAAVAKNPTTTRAHLKKDADLAEHINFALAEDNLSFTGSSAVHHLIEVLVQDVGPEEIKARVRRPLSGLKVAPYYGCQILRPRKDHEDVEQPRFFEDLVTAIGAERSISPPAALPRRRADHHQSEAALSMVRNCWRTPRRAPR